MTTTPAAPGCSTTRPRRPSAYAYIATRIGDQAEAQWAQGAYTSLLNATNAGLAANEKANDFDFLPCEVNVPVTADRCNSSSDANWASQALWGENPWTIFLQGGQLNGILGDPAQTDNLDQMGFARLQGSLPDPSFGAGTGYSVALNTAYAAAGLYSDEYRDRRSPATPGRSPAPLGARTRGGKPTARRRTRTTPGRAATPRPSSARSPTPGRWPARPRPSCSRWSPRAWSGRQEPGYSSVSYRTALYIGRGVPDAWIVPGQSISVGHLTSSYDESNGRRDTDGVRISVGRGQGAPLVTVSLTGDVPGNDVQIQLPAFADMGVTALGGRYDAATHTVTLSPGRGSAVIQLGNAARPSLAVQVASTVPGQHTQPTLTAGIATTATGTITNNGHTGLRNVTLTPQTPQGWTVTATSATSFATMAPGTTKTATWSVTPPADENGSDGLVVSASYEAGFGAAGSASAEQWMHVQRPLPLPSGATDLALTATPSASYSSPWTTVTAINNGIYPVQSNDDNDLTPYWGTWPEAGAVHGTGLEPAGHDQREFGRLRRRRAGCSCPRPGPSSTGTAERS